MASTSPDGNAPRPSGIASPSPGPSVPSSLSIRKLVVGAPGTIRFLPAKSAALVVAGAFTSAS